MTLTEHEVEQQAKIIVAHISHEAIKSEWETWDKNWTSESFYTKPSTYFIVKRAYELSKDS